MDTGFSAARLAGCVTALLFASAFAHAAECVNFGVIDAQSGNVANAIAELYTAEGCDSCPPADKWFSSLGDRKGNVVPLAFHVDYWDGGGWKDRFAKPAFTRRQQESVVRLGSRTVVTPQLFMNGKNISFIDDDKRGSIHSRFGRRVVEIASQPPGARLKLTAVPTANGMEATLSVTPADVTSGSARAWLAVTENKLVSRVTAGENRGVTLYHDHVVRDLVGPLDIITPTPQKIALDQEWKRQDLSLVAFVQDRLTGDVLQALSAGMCAN